jgi:caa(3)-type oxidase subunit IV
MKVFAWPLVGLTILTVVTAKGMDLSPFNGAVAFLIAATKAALVMAFFMQLLYSRPYELLHYFGQVFGFVLTYYLFSA